MSDMRLSCRDPPKRHKFKTCGNSGLGWLRHDKTDAYRTSAQYFAHDHREVTQGLLTITHVRRSMHWKNCSRLQFRKSLHHSVGVLRVRHVVGKWASLVINQGLSCTFDHIRLSHWFHIATLMKEI